LKTQLDQREYNKEDELYEVMDEMLTGLSIEMIETVFIFLCLKNLNLSRKEFTVRNYSHFPIGRGIVSLSSADLGDGEKMNARNERHFLYRCKGPLIGVFVRHRACTDTCEPRPDVQKIHGVLPGKVLAGHSEQGI
jgi:hypothetical protein